MCRLLVLDRNAGSIAHRDFRDILGYLKKGDLLVLNDTKVLPSRIFGKRKSGGRVELLLLKRKDGLIFEAMIRPGRLKLGEKISFNSGSISAEVISRNEVVFNARSAEEIYGLGVMPLPPYIKRPAEETDNADYQTVYAKNEGAIASPTAGLHFTPELLESLAEKGVKCAYLTLHVGTGTFKPVRSEVVTSHKMDAEYFKIPEKSAQLIEEARKNESRVIAVGTTSLRALESYASGKKEGETDLFILPGYKFKMTDCLLTNFHLPKTTLFMLVCAFAEERLIKKAYQEAIDMKYRFYSYGDAMLII
jgi:S-adenosylmethionine:tRNA ribosyltransferase-isomerase